MGVFDDFLNIVKAAGGVVASVSSITDALKKLDDASTELGVGLSKQFGYNQQLSAQYEALAKEATYLEERNSALTKAFGINREGAAKLSQEFSKLSKEFKIGDSFIKQYAVSIKNMLPTLNQLTSANNSNYKALIQVNDVLTKRMGLTAKEAEEYSFYATQQGKNAKEQLVAAATIAKTLDPEGTMGYLKTITQDIAGAGAELQIQYGKLPGNLEMAALKGRALGFSLDQMQKTAANMLNIEQSIGQELEYQLLSGHRLVDASGASLTNAYRQAALTGNMSKQADTLLTILENEGDVLENNLFARQQMSQLLGMDERTLARSLQKKKLLDSIGGGSQLFELEGAALSAAAADMLKAGEMSQAQFDELMKVSDNRTTEEVLKEQLEVARDAMQYTILQTQQLSIIAAASEKALSQSTIDAIQKSFLDLDAAKLKSVGVAYLGKQGAEAMVDTLQTATKGTPATVQGPINQTNDDMAIIPSGYGDTIISRPEGSIALNNNDSVLAGTNLFGGGNGSTDMAQFAAMIVNAIREQTSTLNTTMRSDPTFGRGLNDGYYS